MLPSGGMGNGRIFTANTMGGSAAYWHLQRSGYLPWLVGVIVILSASWWGYSRGAGTTLDEISALQKKIMELEAQHQRTHLDIATNVQRMVSEQATTLLSGPLIQKTYPSVLVLPGHMRRRILVTGGAGFVGSHLVDALMLQGHYVYVLDNLFTGRTSNIEHWMGHPHFQFFQHDVVQPFYIEVDQIYHLACPASPPHYQYNPIKTIKTSTQGTLNMLGLAKRVSARLLFTSTSEVYGDPEVHPQNEDYWGNVNTMGPRSCYDEGKRVAETMCFTYSTEEGVSVRIARIFNTFGPRMHPNDGRVVSNFIIQALKGVPLTIYGDGSQTRSFQYVSDLVTGLIKLMNSDYDKPVNIGNPDEYTILDFANKVKGVINPSTQVKLLPATQDDPKQRKPDIGRAKTLLGWEPKMSVDEGLFYTTEYFREELSRGGSQVLDPTAVAAAEKRSEQLAAQYNRRDVSPLWTATIINSALTDKEKGLAPPETVLGQ